MSILSFIFQPAFSPYYRWLLIVSMSFLLALNIVQAQETTPMNRKISVQFNNETPVQVLEKIGKAAGFSFSYNPEIVKSFKNYTGKFENKSVAEILKSVFGDKIQFKVKGNYVIVSKNTSPPPSTPLKSAPSTAIWVSGTIQSNGENTGLPEVTLYDLKTLNSTISDAQGNFRLKIEKPGFENRIAVKKANFLDTIIVVSHQSVNNLSLNIRAIPTTTTIVEILNSDTISPESNDILPIEDHWVEADGDTLVPGEYKRIFPLPFMAKARTEMGINQRNVQDDLYRPWQVSFLPYIGSNHKLSGNIINDYSFNILGGVSLGTRKLEVGGLFNVDRGHMAKAQLGGMLNFVGLNAYGVQMGGIMNYVGGDVVGAQFGGINNVNMGTTSGAQIGGIFNFTRDTMNGFQAAGILNVSQGKVNGVQSSGILNVSTAAINGAQLAGIMNFQRSKMNGVQMAGIINRSRDTLQGAQISGMLNSAEYIKGVQLGVLNFADSIKGTQIGLFSYARKGYHKIELAADEIFLTNLAFRTGANHWFYNIFTAGFDPTFSNGDNIFWTVGYGIGTSPKIAKKWYLNIDITGNHSSHGKLFTGQLNMLAKTHVGLEFQAAKKFSVFAGATVNAQFRDKTFSEYPETFSYMSPRIIWNTDVGNTGKMDMWMGFRAGIRFL